MHLIFNQKQYYFFKMDYRDPNYLSFASFDNSPAEFYFNCPKVPRRLVVNNDIKMHKKDPKNPSGKQITTSH